MTNRERAKKWEHLFSLCDKEQAIAVVGLANVQKIAEELRKDPDWKSVIFAPADAANLNELRIIMKAAKKVHGVVPDENKVEYFSTLVANGQYIKCLGHTEKP
jgi:hypothetical protein